MTRDEKRIREEKRIRDEIRHRTKLGHRMLLTIEAAGLRQSEAARSLGITPYKLGNWVRGATYPRYLPLINFAEVFNVSLDFLLRGNGELEQLAKLMASRSKAAPEASGKGSKVPESRVRESSGSLSGSEAVNSPLLTLS